MTSSNGNIFRVTGPLRGEFTGPGEFPAQRPVPRSFDVFFDLSLNKRLSKQSWGWWSETPPRSLWRQCHETAPVTVWVAFIKAVSINISIYVAYNAFVALQCIAITPWKKQAWTTAAEDETDIGLSVNSLRAKFCRGNINIYLNFMSIFHIDVIHVLKILPQVRPGPTYCTLSIPWLLMSWRRKESGHHQPWYWRS